MPKLSDRIRNLLTRHVDQRGLVVWYDPERAHERFVANLDLARMLNALRTSARQPRGSESSG